MTAALYHGFNGLVFGQHPDADAGDIPYELVSGDGAENLEMSTGVSSQPGGSDGRGILPMWADPGSWVTVVEIYGADTAEWIERRDALRAATATTLTRRTELPYDMGYGAEDVRTRFARVAKRSIPVDEQYLVRRFAEAQLVFTSADALTYGPLQTLPLDRSESAPIDSGGWCPSQRWRWLIEGPALNPRLVVSADGQPDQVIRFAGNVSPGQQLEVVSTPHELSATVGGANRFGDFDGGSPGIEAVFPSVLPGAQTVTYTAGFGSSGCVFEWRTALV